MSDANLWAVKAEAQRVIADVDAVMGDRRAAEEKAEVARVTADTAGGWSPSPAYFHNLKLTSALRRHSMDLTRALAEMRRR